MQPLTLVQKDIVFVSGNNGAKFRPQAAVCTYIQPVDSGTRRSFDPPLWGFMRVAWRFPLFLQAFDAQPLSSALYRSKSAAGTQGLGRGSTPTTFVLPVIGTRFLPRGPSLTTADVPDPSPRQTIAKGPNRKPVRFPQRFPLLRFPARDARGQPSTASGGRSSSSQERH